MTMQRELVNQIRTATHDELVRAGYRFHTPFVIELDQGELIVDQVVRLIPGRRMVVFGIWRGMPVAAKLFYAGKNAVRHLSSEVNGIKIMQENKIPTPLLRYEGVAADKKTQILIFDRLIKAESLETLWRKQDNMESIIPVLYAAIIEIATQHVLGVVQKDMHMGNFLVEGKIIYTLDGGQIKAKPELLSKEDSMNHLALFLSQLGVGIEELQEQLFLHYARARGWLLKPQDSIEMRYLIRKWNEERWKDYAKKIFRNSTEFMAVKRFGIHGMTRRDVCGKEFELFLQNPESAFTHSSMTMLKNGGSSTVIKVTLDNREWVIKRYNMKSIWHRMRRLLRQTRAHKSWRLAQKLDLFNVNTPKPVAYLESNYFGLRGKSYYVSEYVRGTDLKTYLLPYAEQAWNALPVIQRVVQLLRALAKIEITHGDLKASNIIMNENAQPAIIDLDGAAEHFTVTGLQKAWRSELKRFLLNFTDAPALADLFRRALRK